LYGNWDFVEANDMAVYNRSDGARHLVTGLNENIYVPTKPLVSVWNFNVAPQMPVLFVQIGYDNKKVYILEEILDKLEEKENNTPALARKVRMKLYRDKHIGGVDVTGALGRSATLYHKRGWHEVQAKDNRPEDRSEVRALRSSVRLSGLPALLLSAGELVQVQERRCKRAASSLRRSFRRDFHSATLRLNPQIPHKVDETKKSQSPTGNWLSFE